MSIRAIELEIIAKARIVLKNPKLRLKDIQEWSSGEITPHEGEIVIKIPELGLDVAFKKEVDKRP